MATSAFPINGLFWWPQKNCVLAVCNGKTFKITYSSGVATITDLTSATLELNSPVSCALGWTPAFASYAFLANGGNIIYTDGTATTTALTTSGVPTAVNQLASIDGYILANNLSTASTDLRNKVFHSPVNDPLAAGGWSQYFAASGDSDAIQSIKVLNRQIYAVGQTTTEIWENDGTSPFSRTAGGFVQTGCIAPFSTVVSENAMFWLNQDRHFVQWVGGKLTRISSPYDKDLSRFSAVADCEGYRVEVDGVPLIIWAFPTENRTLVYNYGKEDWAEWRHWDSDAMEYDRWIGGCHVWVPDWGLHLVGSRLTSTIYSMSADVYTDAGDEIRMLRESGHIDYKTTRQKISKEFRIRAKRGSMVVDTVPKLMLRWKDDNRRWSNLHELSLGDEGDTSLVLRLQRTGIYRTRKYELTATDAVPIVFGDAEEDIVVSGR